MLASQFTGSCIALYSRLQGNLKNDPLRGSLPSQAKGPEETMSANEGPTSHCIFKRPCIAFCHSFQGLYGSPFKGRIHTYSCINVKGPL